MAKVEPLADLDFGQLEPRVVTVHVPADGVAAATPLLIALDGQNMPAWRMDEALAGLAAGNRRAPLVVAIPSAHDRLDEYGMVGWPDYAGRGKRAEEFQRFVAGVVVPAVRKRFGLRADPALTGVMGSSLGGLAAFDLAWRHPEVFGFAGVFSGSFWWRGEDGSVAVRQASRLAHRRVRQTSEPPAMLRLWFSVGTKEETDDRDGNGVIDAVQDTTELLDELVQKGWSQGDRLAFVLVADGEHNETAWAKQLPGFLRWALPPP